MRDCKEFSVLVNLHCDGLLTDEENAALTEHLDHCPSCANKINTLRAVSEQLTNINPPDTLTPGILLLASREPIPRKHWKRFLPRSITFAAAAIALLIYLSVYPGEPLNNDTILSFTDSLESASPENYGITEDTIAENPARARLFLEPDTFSTMEKQESAELPDLGGLQNEFNADSYLNDTLYGVFLIIGEIPPEFSKYSPISGTALDPANEVNTALTTNEVRVSKDDFDLLSAILPGIAYYSETNASEGLILFFTK